MEFARNFQIMSTIYLFNGIFEKKGNCENLPDHVYDLLLTARVYILLSFTALLLFSFLRSLSGLRESYCSNFMTERRMMQSFVHFSFMSKIISLQTEESQRAKTNK